MIAEVDLKAVPRALLRVEVVDLHAGIPKLVLVPSGEGVAAHLVVEEVDADTLPRLRDQSRLDLSAQLVVFDDEELKEDVIPGSVDPSEDARERVLTVDEEVDRVPA